jgi:hypothetical protein
MRDMLITDVSPAYRTENDRELCKELDSLEKMEQDGKVFR